MNGISPHAPDDEELVAKWLAPLDEDAAPIRPDVIDRATRNAGEVFAHGDSAPAPTPSMPPKQGRKDLNIKAVVALSALALSVVVLLVNMGRPVDGRVTLGAILDQAGAAETLQLQVVNKAVQADVWVRTSGQVRWEETPSQYQIALGSRRWRIDEAANTVTDENNSWFRDERNPVDLLALLGIDAELATAFRQAIPERVEMIEGQWRQVYRAGDSGGYFRPKIHAYVDPETGQLQQLEAWVDWSYKGRSDAAMTLVARDIVVDETQFVVSKTLSEDGRIGKVAQSQGTVTLRPPNVSRWTPVSRQMLVKPGDWIRSDVRGANAAAVAITSRFGLIVGPASLVELVGPSQVRLHRGELKVTGSKSATVPCALLGPGEQAVTIGPGESAHYRVGRDSQLVKVAKKPVWLAGFEGSSNNESIGSLVCNIDGRSRPLTVGLHKVKVEIRDQIARTTIEESFVNHTNEQLEGEFHFPLPQDASISGFGMWINGELIEADVVEKQRAREIYETILREKRDPGLLEWTGGNIFKARVFPILPHSEKRIKIVYTQVLSLRANRYRYSYALASEMLKKTPLRELSIEVLINSAIPLKAVSCTTHEVRSQQTPRSAKVEFTAQEYTPTRDFEVVCEVDSRQSDVVVVPHQRGEDGYFLLQLTPPTGAGNWQREVLPDGAPLDLLLVCDTSGSMDAQKRKQQAQFVATVLATLGRRDRFNLAVSDVNCDWLHETPVASTPEAVAAALTWLDERLSLGWTDLDRMVASVSKRLSDKTHVVYVGDGIVTAGDADPQAFANRLQRLTGDQRGGTFHAVSIGSSFESTVLKAIARVGGGSVRHIAGEQTPQQVAFELLNEMAQPGLRNLKVEFRGLQVAAVYPSTLANLPAGAQQILVGRYLPQGESQTGEIVITGQRDGQPVSFTSRIKLADAEAGNSFIPRLWARAHLDQLLEEGSSALVRDQIIALSEEFHIITPHTSLLVLETDEDRERFGVQRRFQMRDGERFFADGRDDATFALRQQQVKRAGDWRLALRRRVLAELTRLGRDPRAFESVERRNSRLWRMDSTLAWGGYGGGGFRNGLAGSAGKPSKSRQISSPWLEEDFGGAMEDLNGELGEFDARLSLSKRSNIFGDDRELNASQSLEDDFEVSDFQQANERVAKAEKQLYARDDISYFLQPKAKSRFGSRLSGRRQPAFGGFDRFDGDRSLRGRYGNFEGSAGNSIQWLDTLYPTIPPVPVPSRQPADSTWPAEAIAISQSLLQPITIDAGGIEVERQHETADPRWSRQTGVSRQVELFSPGQWVTLSENATTQTLVQWCDDQQRGSYSRAFQLGRWRQATPRDLAALVPGRRAFAVTPLHETYRRYDVEIERSDDGQLTLILTNQESTPVAQHRILIDTKKNVVIRVEGRSGGAVVSATKYDDYVRAAGTWWPGTIESLDAQSRRTSLTTQTVRVLKPAPFSRRIGQELPDRDAAQLLPTVLPTVRQAEVAAADGSADFDDRLVLLLQASLIQDWDVVLKELAELEQLVPAKPGIAWIRAAVLAAARKNDQVRQLLIEQADRIAAAKRVDAFFLAEYLLGQTSQVADQNEVQRLLERLQPVFQRQPEFVTGILRWEIRFTETLRALGRLAEVVPRQHDLATAMPWDGAMQTRYARDLATSGDYDAAGAWLRQELDRDVERTEYEKRLLRMMFVTLLREKGRAAELVDFFEQWVATNPTYQDVYAQYLHALIMADRTPDADAIARTWLADARVPGKLDPISLARLNTASNYARGQRYQTFMNWIDPAWFGDLEQTARFFLGHEDHFYVASSIMDYHRFVDSDESDRLRADVAGRLVASSADLPPVQIAAYVRWALKGQEITAQQWKKIAATLRLRWEQTADASQRQTLSGALVQIYATHFHDSDHLPFLRQRIVRAEQESRPDLAANWVNALFVELLARSWTADNEKEAIALIPRLSASQYQSQQYLVQIRELHRFVDRMLEARQQVDRKQLQDTGHPEKLTRAELGEKYAQFKQRAQEGLAARLTDVAPEFDDMLRDWVTAERMYLDLRLARRRRQVAAECWMLLGDAPQVDPVLDAEIDEKAAETLRQDLLRDLLRERALAMVSYLAVRRSAPQPLLARLLQYVAAGMQLEDDVARQWRQHQFRLLVALDRPEELERELRTWIRDDEAPADWQLALGRLLAEQGKIDDAVPLFETVQRASRLSPQDYATLADWYLVADRRAEHDRARIEVYKSMEEYRIRQWLQQQSQPWYRSDVPLPSELDENVLFAFGALFEKSNRPGDYVHQLREFYTACRDFRLLRMVPDSLTGRTPQQVYPFLKSLRSDLLYEIRKEATADELLARIDEVRQATDVPVDLRALDLLEAMIERLSAEVINQPGPHTDAAVAALQRAFDHPWAEGEVRQMADVLADLGKIKHAKLNDERRRQLRELLKMTEPGTEDRFYVAYYLATALFYSDEDQLQGLATMENALREISPQHPAGWPAHLNPLLEGYLTMLDSAGRFAAAEQFVSEHLANPLNTQQMYWLTQQRNRLLVSALRKDGRVSLGSGVELFVNLEKHLLEQGATSNDNHRQQVVSQLLNLYDVAKDKNIAEYKQHLQDFAFTGLPPMLKRQTNHYQSVVRQTADTVHRLLGPRIALKFLIERFETYPQRFTYTYEAPWQVFSSQLAEWFRVCGRNIGDYEPRLLAIVLHELRHDLRVRSTRNHYLYHRGYDRYFWVEKAAAFSRVAEEVYQERKGSGRSVTYIAQYLYGGLRKPDRAIQMLLDAHRNELLDTQQQIVLCDFLHAQSRHLESIPLLEPIVADAPDTMAYRTRLIRAYARSSKRGKMRALLTATDKHFRQQGRWTESNLSQLAWCCLDIELFAESAAYYGELIPMHQRSQPNGGVGNGTLSTYYRDQSRAFTGLGETIKAVEAAAGGVVAGVTRRGYQSGSRHWIENALRGAEDLDGYVKHLDREVAARGQDSPLIRQSLGIVYASRNEHEQAIVQFRLAVELQPTDSESHEALIKSYDKLNDQDGAVRQTLAMLDFDRHNLELYKKLADRLKSDEQLFERAATTIVEAAPNEAEHHQALAEIRQQHDRWDEAIDHWKHVARLRALEPNGLLKLTEAQLHQKQWDSARESIRQLNQQEWAPRFNQVRSQTEALQSALPPR